MQGFQGRLSSLLYKPKVTSFVKDVEVFTTPH